MIQIYVNKRYDGCFYVDSINLHNGSLNIAKFDCGGWLSLLGLYSRLNESFKNFQIVRMDIQPPTSGLHILTRSIVKYAIFGKAVFDKDTVAQEIYDAMRSCSFYNPEDIKKAIEFVLCEMGAFNIDLSIRI
jgi:hypothetical protein